jgi:NAD(P)-dependent dehydrogenase (short-subunit alcohol dehydrogenase family)
MGMLDGRVAIVTGASSGVGRACALRFAEEGAVVVACARRLNLLEELAAEAGSKGGEVVPLACDVGEEADIASVVDTAAERFGRIDILANIAQGFIPDTDTTSGTLMNTTPESLLDMFRTGPVQSMLFMQKCFPHMKEQGYGRIVNTSSHAYLLGAPGLVAYGIAKAGTAALTRHASKDWGQYGIVTNTFFPMVVNPRWEEANPEAAARMPAMIPVRRMGTAYDDLSPVIAFFVSEGAGYLNGQSIAIDGGMQLLFP